MEACFAVESLGQSFVVLQLSYRSYLSLGNLDALGLSRQLRLRIQP